MEMKSHEILEQKMCKELDALEEKMMSGADMSMNDLEKIDKLYHALKSKATYDAMKEAKYYSEEGMSGYRGRDTNGRFVSREDGRSYTDGYSQGYSEAMSQMNQIGNSGHYYQMPSNMTRRW